MYLMMNKHLFSINSASYYEQMINFYNKEWDNSFLFYDTAEELINYLKINNYRLKGFCQLPKEFQKKYYCHAIILQDVTNEEIYWAHIDKDTIKRWYKSYGK